MHACALRTLHLLGLRTTHHCSFAPLPCWCCVKCMLLEIAVTAQVRTIGPLLLSCSRVGHIRCVCVWYFSRGLGTATIFSSLHRLAVLLVTRIIICAAAQCLHVAVPDFDATRPGSEFSILCRHYSVLPVYLCVAFRLLLTLQVCEVV